MRAAGAARRGRRARQASCSSAIRCADLSIEEEDVGTIIEQIMRAKERLGVRLRLYAQVVGIQARKRMGYRADFWIERGRDVLRRAGRGLLLCGPAIFRETGRARSAGSRCNGMVVYYVAVILLGKIVKGNERDRTISDDIYEGGLTRYLLYPVELLRLQVRGAARHARAGARRAGALRRRRARDAAVARATSTSRPRRSPWPPASVAVSNLLHFMLDVPDSRRGVLGRQHVDARGDVPLREPDARRAAVAAQLFPEWSQPALDLLPFKYLYCFPATTLLGHVDARGVGRRHVDLDRVVRRRGAGRQRAVWRRGTLQYTGVGI